MLDIFLIMLAGALGGTLRGLIGYFKYFNRFKNIAFKPLHFFGMVGVSALVGLLAAWAVSDLEIKVLGFETLPPAMAFIIGYAGGDFIENFFKIVTKKNFLVDMLKMK